MYLSICLYNPLNPGDNGSPKAGYKPPPNLLCTGLHRRLPGPVIKICVVLSHRILPESSHGHPKSVTILCIVYGVFGSLHTQLEGKNSIACTDFFFF